ncbi:anti-sigma factor [Gordonia polyisoprenivorans]|uniref:anti-sigma factor n=1 Tax=Gordonia polyisoprenivorans TaxID=84595 RepID=UPI001AD63E0C|nr:anti-sigma factor [Gordonia polyisoprenivorans]QTI69711.1 anti-sigma factor [Gordonia polyisoprenivorans]
MSDDELLAMAPLMGLDALSPAELDSVRRRRAQADDAVRAEFDALVAATRETMASVSASTAMTPPAELRARLLAAATAEARDTARPTTAGVREIRPRSTDDVARSDAPGAGASGGAATVPDGTRTGRRIAYLAAAAVVAVAVGAIGWAIGSGLSSKTTTEQPTAAKVFSAKDVRTSSGSVATGRASVTYSERADAAVLVMNDVPPPQPGTVYQMWLLGPQGTTLAGTMTDKDIAPSTTAVIPHIGDATALGFSVEPAAGATSPGSIVAELPLR